MSAISTILTRLRAAIWAIDVRDDIANAIEQCYSDVSNPTLQTEALEAALQNKIDQGEMAALTIADGSLTGAKLANGTISTAKIADGAITTGKIASGVIPAVDTTLTQSGFAADAAETGRQIGLIKADLDAQTGIISLLKDYYIKTSTTPISLTPIASTAGRMCAVVDCTAGDKFVINAFSNSSQARAWCFVNNTNNAISMADADVPVTGLELTAPENAVKLIINDISGGMSYKVGNNLASKIWTDLDAIEGAVLTTGARNALINFLDAVAVTDSEGDALFEALKVALLGDLVAVYDQSAIVDMGTNLKTLKTDLTVKAVKSDGTIAIIDDYELSGNLNEEISNITVTTNRSSAVFKVLCAPAGRWINNVLTISSDEIEQGSYIGQPPEYFNKSKYRVIYKGAKVDFDKRYKYTVSVASSKMVDVAVRGIKKNGADSYKNNELMVAGTTTDTGWQSNGYVFNAEGEAEENHICLWIPVRRTDNVEISPSDISSITVTRALR